MYSRNIGPKTINHRITLKKTHHSPLQQRKRMAALERVIQWGAVTFDLHWTGRD